MNIWWGRRREESTVGSPEGPSYTSPQLLTGAAWCLYPFSLFPPTRKRHLQRDIYDSMRSQRVLKNLQRTRFVSPSISGTGNTQRRLRKRDTLLTGEGERRGLERSQIMWLESRCQPMGWEARRCSLWTKLVHPPKEAWSSINHSILWKQDVVKKCR